MTNIIKESIKYLGWVLLCLFLWLKGCSRSSTNDVVQIQKVIVPKVEGKFESKVPVHELVLKSKKRPKIGANNALGKPLIIADELIEMTRKNEEQLTFYEKSNDSLKKELYKKSTVLNKFSTKFEDDNILLNINGIVQGEVQEITPNYTIKEKNIDVKPIETVFRLLAGVEVGNNDKFDNFKAKANLMLQNRKGNIMSASFDTNNTIWIGYNFSIFNINR